MAGLVALRVGVREVLEQLEVPQTLGRFVVALLVAPLSPRFPQMVVMVCAVQPGAVLEMALCSPLNAVEVPVVGKSHLRAPPTTR